MNGPSVPLIVWRGVRKRCGRCGTRARFQRWFRISERCPRCGYRFAREEGFFTGVYLINYSITGLAIVGVVFAYLGVVITSGETVGAMPFLVAGAVLAVVVPLVCYPFAVTTWAALDLAMRPLDPVEEAEASLHADEEWLKVSRAPESPA